VDVKAKLLPEERDTLPVLNVIVSPAVDVLKEVVDPAVIRKLFPALEVYEWLVLAK
jgi:hypothetical protein